MNKDKYMSPPLKPAAVVEPEVVEEVVIAETPVTTLEVPVAAPEPTQVVVPTVGITEVAPGVFTGLPVTKTITDKIVTNWNIRRIDDESMVAENMLSGEAFSGTFVEFNAAMRDD